MTSVPVTFNTHIGGKRLKISAGGLIVRLIFWAVKSLAWRHGGKTGRGLALSFGRGACVQYKVPLEDGRRRGRPHRQLATPPPGTPL